MHMYMCKKRTLLHTCVGDGVRVQFLAFSARGQHAAVFLLISPLFTIYFPYQGRVITNQPKRAGIPAAINSNTTPDDDAQGY